MWRIKGWLLDSLKYQIDKQFRESIYGNAAYKENSWKFFERQILCWSRLSLLYVLLLLVAFFLIFGMAFLWYPQITKLVPIGVNWGPNLTGWLGTYLNGQLTIIGVIFPLVVGFVAILLQNKSGNRTLWEIYSRYSGFMFTGFSGLMLSAVIIFEQLIRPWLHQKGEMLCAIGISGWLIFNLVLTAWFLYVTFRFMNIGYRNDLVLRYCINETLISDIYFRLSKTIATSAIETELAKARKNGKVPLLIKAIHYSQTQEQIYGIDFKSDKYLKDIYFKVLKIAVWLFSSKSEKTEEGESVLLVLPSIDSRSPDKKWILAITNGVRFSWLERLCIRASYVFGNSPPIEPSGFEAVLEALFGNIEDALRGENVRQFDNAVKEMEKWHVDIMKVAAFINDDGEWDNWLLLGDGFLGRSLLDELAREYYELARSVIQYLPKTNRYFEIYCSSFLRIYGYKNETLAKRAVKNLISNHYRIWVALISWQSNSDNSSGAGLQYERALRDYIGRWEHWSYRLLLDSSQWTHAKQDMDNYLHHLECSALLVVSSFRHKEFKSAEWAADVLVHWYENFHFDRNNYQYLWRTEFLVPPLIGLNIKDPVWIQILNGQSLDNADAVCGALSNAWFDIRLVTAAFLFGKELSSNERAIVVALINEERLRPTGTVRIIHHRISSGADILQAYLRQLWFCKHDDGFYRGWLDGVIGGFHRVMEEEHIAGRVYLGSGSSGVSDLEDIYIALAISRSFKKWELSGNFSEFILSAALTQQNREDIVTVLKKWQKPSVEVVKKAKIISGEEYNKTLLENYKSSILSIVEEIEDKNKLAVIDAPIDDEKLYLIGRDASSKILTSGEQGLPLSLFNDIIYSNTFCDTCQYSIIYSNYRRSELVKDLEVNHFSSSDHWSNAIYDHVSLTIFRRLINEIDYVESIIGNEKQLIGRMIDDARKIYEEGKTPIFFVGPTAVIGLLNSALWGYGEDTEELQFTVRKDDGYPDSYFCHVGDIEVYRLPFHQVDFCILVEKECFDLIQIRKIEDSRCVDVKFSEDENDRTKGKLKLSYWMKVDFKSLHAYKYILDCDNKS